MDMACEQTVCPTWTHDLSNAVYTLIANPVLSAGIYLAQSNSTLGAACAAVAVVIAGEVIGALCR